MASKSLKKQLVERAKAAAEKVNKLIDSCSHVIMPLGHERKGRGISEFGGTELVGVDLKNSRSIMGGKLTWVTYITKAVSAYTNSETGENYELTTHTVRHSNGMSAVVIVNEEFILIQRSYRFPIEMFIWNLPRCFTFDYGPSEDQVNEFFGNHKYQWLKEDGKLVSHDHAGSYFQDSGTDATEVQVYVIKINIEEDLEKVKDQIKKDFIKFNFVSFEEVEKMIREGNFKEAHDIATWYTVKNYLANKDQRL